MKVDVGSGLNIELTEIFNPVILRSDKEKVSVCFRDGVIELGLWVEGENGKGWDVYRVGDGDIKYLDFRIINIPRRI